MTPRSDAPTTKTQIGTTTVPANDLKHTQMERNHVIEALGPVLADTFTLYLKTHGYHWNVTGPHFPQLHAMFETQYTELWEAIDDIAERIRALGGAAPATMAEYQGLAVLHEDGGATNANDMVKKLASDHESIKRTLQKAKQAALDINDDETHDMMIQRIQIHDKTAWMLRATASA